MRAPICTSLYQGSIAPQPSRCCLETALAGAKEEIYPSHHIVSFVSHSTVLPTRQLNGAHVPFQTTRSPTSFTLQIQWKEGQESESAVCNVNPTCSLEPGLRLTLQGVKSMEELCVFLHVFAICAQPRGIE